MAPAIELFAGPLFVCICFALITFGIFTAQVYFYWRQYEDDATHMKVMVSAMWFLEALHTAFCIYIMYQYFVRDFGKPEAVNDIPWEVGGTVILEITIVAICQGFYIYRIWQLSRRNKWATIIPAIALACRLIFGIATLSFLYIFKAWDEFSQHKGPLAALDCTFAFAALVDLICTVLLTYYLRQHRTSFRRTQRMIQTLIFYTINTGALTMVFSMTILFTFTFVPDSLLFMGFVEIVSKLYANSVLAMINARQHIKNQGLGSGAHNTIPLSIPGPLSHRKQGETDHVHVAIMKETATDSLPDSGTTSEPRESSVKNGYELA